MRFYLQYVALYVNIVLCSENMSYQKYFSVLNAWFFLFFLIIVEV